MKKGIAILGLNGAGKSTLSHELAKKINYFEMDVEDYYFPEQKLSRKNVLDNKKGIETQHLGDLPFSKPREKSKVQEMILKDIKNNPRFILSGVSMNWNRKVCSSIKIAFLVEAPLSVRLKRIEKREKLRFGRRVIVGGDMYSQQQEFLKTVAARDFDSVLKSTEKLSCSVIRLDGILPINENIEKILDCLNISKD